MSSGFDPVPSDRLEVTSEVGAALTDFDYRVLASLLKSTHALRLPKDTISYLVERMALDALQIPVSQLSGFSGFTARAALVAAEQTTTSTTYVDLTTVGPQLTGLADGYYLVVWGAQQKISLAGDIAVMAISYNGAAADNDYQSRADNVNNVASRMAFNTQTLSNGNNNSILAKYRTGSGNTGTFGARTLLALKYSEL